MNFHKIFTSVIDRLAPHRAPVIIGTVGLIFLVSGLISLLGTSHSNNTSDFSDISQVKGDASASAQISAQIFIDIEGAVVSPGVYNLSQSARMRDLFIAAKGLSSDADRSWVEKHINLAAKLTDSEKVYIPRLGENSSSISTYTNSSFSNDSNQASGLIDINSATSNELDSLPGVGPVTAEKIISNRPYSSIQDLLDKKVVGQSEFEKIKDKITIN